MLYKKIHRFWTHSIYRQLMLGITLVHSVLMTIFVFDIVSREKNFLTQQNREHAEALVHTLSNNVSSWVLANDFIGIEEVIKSQTAYPQLRYVMFINLQGKVLGFSDRKQVGRYIHDKTSLQLLKHQPGNSQDFNRSSIVLIENNDLIDLAYPIFFKEQLLGWSRASISRTKMNQNLLEVSVNGLIYTAVAILIGIFFAYFMARRLTVDIASLNHYANSVKEGSGKYHFSLDRHDELGKLADNFSDMVQVLLSKELEAQSAYQTKSEFLSNISHEIKTPLNAIMGISQLLYKDKNELNHSRQQSLEILHESSGNLLNLIKNILDYSRLEANATEVRMEPFSLHQLVNQVVSLLKLQVKQKQLELIVTIDKNITDSLCGDPLKLSRILTNILHNAIKFTPISLNKDKPNSIYFTINLLKSNSKSLELEFIVKDSGKGFKQEEVGNIFKPFSQLDNTSTRHSDGVGLGLNIVKSLVDLLNGKVRIQSKPEQGTTFTVQLPFDIYHQKLPVNELEQQAPDELSENVYLDLNEKELEQLKNLLPRLWYFAQQSNVQMYDSFEIIKKTLLQTRHNKLIDDLEIALNTVDLPAVKQALINISSHFHFKFEE